MVKARIISVIATGIISLHLWLGLPRFISAKEWTKQIVHSEIGHLTNTSIALDNNNKPHVSYYHYTNGDLMYALSTGSSWDIQTVESNAGGFNSIAIDSNNYPHISYTASGGLKYAWWSGSKWNKQIVDPTENVGSFLSMVLDSYDKAHISYYDGTNEDLKYARRTGSNWDIQTVDSIGDVGFNSSLAVDSNDYPHIGYGESINYANENLKYARWTGSSWNIQTVDSQNGTIGDISLALDSNNYPHMSYSTEYVFTQNDAYVSLHGYSHEYAQWTGSSWNFHNLIGGNETSITLDDNDYPHIVSSNNYVQGFLIYLHGSGSNWSTEYLEFEDDFISYFESPDIALDIKGNPHICYFENSFVMSRGNVRYATSVSGDLLGTWDGSGVWYRNSDTGSWVKMTTSAQMVTAGDLDGDNTDDLIGVWSSGLWVKYSSSGSWAKLSTTLPTDIAIREVSKGVNILGNWPSGVWCRYRSDYWSRISTPAVLISAGDIDGDGYDDLIGVWSSGLWVKNMSANSWNWLLITLTLPTSIASGDMNGDGRDDILGTWPSGVWYRNSITGNWVRMCYTPANLVAAGDIDGDGTDDLIGTWASGLWVKNSSTSSWQFICTSLPSDIDAGLFRTGWGAGAMSYEAPVVGVYAEGPGSIGNYEDLTSEGPGSWDFVYRVEENLTPREEHTKMRRVPGPGEPGFQGIEEKNPIPQEEKATKKGKRNKK